MSRITYFENMKGHFKEVTREELDAFRGYENARKYNLEYPLLNDLLFSNAGKVAEIYTSVRIGKFIFATASTGAVESLAQLFLHGYKIIDVINLENGIGDAHYLTACKYGLLIGRK